MKKNLSLEGRGKTVFTNQRKTKIPKTGQKWWWTYNKKSFVKTDITPQISKKRTNLVVSQVKREGLPVKVRRGDHVVVEESRTVTHSLGIRTGKGRRVLVGYYR